MTKLPAKASKYIRDHFREGYLAHVTTGKRKNGRSFFRVKITQDDIHHYLEFGEHGDLTGTSDKPVFEDDYFEGSFYAAED
jgi:hypothetical protein